MKYSYQGSRIPLVRRAGLLSIFCIPLYGPLHQDPPTMAHSVYYPVTFLPSFRKYVLTLFLVPTSVTLNG
jgi:hypothetical protein